MTATGRQPGAPLMSPSTPLEPAWEGLVTGHLATAPTGFVPRLSSLRPEFLKQNSAQALWFSTRIILERN